MFMLLNVYGIILIERKNIYGTKVINKKRKSDNVNSLA